MPRDPNQSHRLNRSGQAPQQPAPAAGQREVQPGGDQAGAEQLSTDKDNRARFVSMLTRMGEAAFAEAVGALVSALAVHYGFEDEAVVRMLDEVKGDYSNEEGSASGR